MIIPIPSNYFLKNTLAVVLTPPAHLNKSTCTNVLSGCSCRSNIKKKLLGLKIWVLGLKIWGFGLIFLILEQL